MRLIIISNRLPLTIKKQHNTFSYKETSGGLVTGLKAVKQTLQFIWLGNIPGIEDDDKETVQKDCWDLYKSIPVFIDQTLNELSYNGFCNGILWPLIHTFPDDVVFSQQYWDAYKEYNKIFCEKVVEIVKDGDIVWVHDYHLMLLPKMLRESIKNCKKDVNVKIGFFLHTPFPEHDIFSVLPYAKKIVAGIMGSDHVAFHTYDYLAHFIRTCAHLLPLESDINGDKSNKIEYHSGTIKVSDREIRLTAIPIGIDPQLFRSTLEKPETKARIAELRKTYGDKTIILGVDRTDYIKGIPNRILGFKKYLEKEINRNTVFLQIGVPSRTDVPEYSSLINTMNTMVTELNSTIGNVNDTYFYMLNQSVKFEELCALYAVSDICLISSLVDGMNLVALEYVACSQGVLMLSEFAGCACTLPGAVFFNPWSVESVAMCIESVVNMGSEERMERWEINKKNVEKFTAVKWAEDNVKGLQDISGSK